jgi:hypothetical protein
MMANAQISDKTMADVPIFLELASIASSVASPGAQPLA